MPVPVAPRTLARIVVLAGVVLAAALNVVKGVPHVVHDLGFPYWMLTYEHGFIRRALVGTLFRALVDGFDADVQRRKVLAIHTTLSFALSAALVVWALAAVRRTPSPRTRVVVLTGCAALFLSQLPTTISILAGYLDVVLVALSAAGAYLADRRRYRAAGVVAALGPVVHDAFVFLWLPVLLVAARRVLRAPVETRRRSAIDALPLLAPAATSALTLAFHSPSAATRAVDALSVPQGIKETFHIFQFGLSTGKAFDIMRDKLVRMPEQVLLACAFFLPAAVVVAACASAIDREGVRWRRVAFAFLVTVAPCSVLLVAWDLSRFLLWATFAAFLLLMANAADEPEDADVPDRGRAAPRPPPLAQSLLVLTILAALSTGPHVYAYFEVAFADYPFAPSATRHTPAAKLSYAFLNTFNRKQFVRAFDSKDGCAVDVVNADKEDGCAVVVRAGGHVETRDVWLEPGDYVATAETQPDEGCVDSTASMTPYVFFRFASPKPTDRFAPADRGRATLRFSIDREEAAMGRVRVRVACEKGCLRVADLRIAREEGP